MFNEMNKQFVNTVKEGIDTENMEFKKLKDFVGKTQQGKLRRTGCYCR